MAKNTNPVAIPTEDGRAIVGGRPSSPEFYETLNRQQSGLPPAGAVKARNQAAPEPVEALPMIGVARQVVGGEILRLRAVEAAIERELSRAPGIGANGMPNAYLIQRAAENRAELEHVREQIARLNNLDDNQMRAKAFELGAR
jgi:hypothetical protein